MLIGILAVVMGFSYLKSSSLFDHSRTFYAVYDHVGGLQTGTQVSLNGLVIGNVTDVRFKDKSAKLLVTFVVNNKFQFSENSKVELFDTGIIGGKGLQIIPSFDEAPPAKDGDTLQTGVRPGLTELVQEKLTPLQMSLEGAFTNADSLMLNINSLLTDRTKLEMQQGVHGFNASMQTFQSSMARVNKLLQDNSANLDSTLKSVANTTAQLSTISNELAKADWETTVKELQGTLTNLNKVLAQIESGQGTLGQMVTNDELYHNLSEVSRELDLFLQDFRLNPKRYVNVSVFGKKQKDYTLPEKDPAAEK